MCNHDINSKDTTIKIDKNKWLGIYPKTYNGICVYCGINFKLKKTNGVFEVVK